MKQSGWICLCLMLVMFFSLPVFAQPSDKSVETIVIDDFDNQDAHDWVWTVQASKFVHKGSLEGDVYPKCGYVPGIPNSLRAYRTDDDTTPLVFGAQVSYDRKGDNWLEIYPADPASEKDPKEPYCEEREAFCDPNNPEPSGINLSGDVTQIDFWVWGSNYNYALDLIVRDCNGAVHVLPATTMNFEGWRNIVVQIPSWLKQETRLRSVADNMKFLGFRVTANPGEYAKDFTIYFDRIRYTTNTLNTVYDGYDLRHPTFDQE